MICRIGLYWRTVRHLTVRQALYQVLNRLRGPARLRLPGLSPAGYFLTVPDADKPVSWAEDTFTFLSQSVRFDDQIDWNYAPNGKLWTYNLNYFDFLNQPGLRPDDGLRLIRDFIRQTRTLEDGLEPYPTSLRIINWVRFLSRHRIQDESINAHLYAQVALLRRRLEYHLSGNHLLENGFALLTGALYFRHRRWFQTADKLLRTELNRQILADGGHDERSPMYHRILLDRLLGVLLALRADSWHNNLTINNFLNVKAAQMQRWLAVITFSNGDVPMVNDAALDVARTWPFELNPVPSRPDVVVQTTSRAASGYRLFRPGAPDRPYYELFVDVGSVGPDHQPGHAHADTFSFVLYVGGQPLIVDSGTSTYATGPRRSWERSTAAHNTVEVDERNSSEVWAGFRVGRRARVTVLEDTETRLTAQHDGYRPWGITHERNWSVGPDKVHISDRLIGGVQETEAGPVGIARFYFHPMVPITLIGQSAMAGPARLSFRSNAKLDLRAVPYELADGFNRLRSSLCLEVEFTNQLETLIIPTA